MTKASSHPLRREVTSTFDGDLIIEVTDRIVTIRPKHTRKGGKAEISIPWGLVYQLGLTRAVPAKKTRKVRRGTVLS